MAVHKIHMICPVCHRSLGDGEPVMYAGPGHTLEASESMVAYWRKYFPDRKIEIKARLDGGVADRYGIHPDCWRWLLDQAGRALAGDEPYDHTAAGD